MSIETALGLAENRQQSGYVVNSHDRPVILTFVGNYLPGYKAGGLVRTIVNTVDHLCDEFEFRIVTRDRDLGDNGPYTDIKHNQWQQVGNAQVFYLPPQSSTRKDIFNVMISTPHQVLWLNSFFDPITIKVLLNIKIGSLPYKPIIVAPRGEFAWASLKQKYAKKLIFIRMARLFKLYGNVTWHAGSEPEALDIIKVMRIPRNAIRVMDDFPIKANPEVPPGLGVQPSPFCDSLKIIFLSRIAREKNLHYAVRVLSKVNARLIFDIYGPAPDATYWKECQDLIARLPANVTVNYLGSADPDEVVRIFSSYDLFLFPTGGEAYGHVIAECLTAGTPVLISTETGWRDLQADGLGWDIELEKEDSFVEIIEKLATLSAIERLEKRSIVKAKIMKRLLNPAVLDAHRQLFSSH